MVVLSKSDYISRVIDIVNCCSRPRTTIDISRVIGISRSSIYHILDDLVKAGLLRKYKSRWRHGETGMSYNVYIAVYVLNKNPRDSVVEIRGDVYGHY